VKRSNDAKIAREEADLAVLLGTLPENPIPWATLLRIVAPILARLAVRYGLKKVKRSLSEDKVNAIGKSVGDMVSGILDKRIPSDKV